MKTYITLLSVFVFLLFACDRGGVDPIDPDDLSDIPYSPQPYNLVIPAGFPQMIIPPDNPLTVEGVELGRRLFYDPIMSVDSTISCASCHLPVGGFTDNKAVSIGVDGIAGTRSAMSLENIGFFNNGLFWDGRQNSLEAQALMPVEDPIEMHHSWPTLELQLREHSDYTTRFRKAFGISKKSEITKDLAAKAIAQFERTLVSSGKSKFDLAQTPGSGVFFTDQEQLGYDIYFQLNGLEDAQCGHCHSGPLLTTNEYHNNGLDEALNLNQFLDKGRGKITNILSDNGKFRTTSLRNIAASAPYMHDGRFQTLEQVVDHYASGGHYADNVSPFMLELKAAGLTPEQKAAVLALLHTMTDTVFLNRPDIQSPF